MLDPFDDFLVHQTADSVAVAAWSDPGVFDRYQFFGRDPSGELAFGATLGLHPNLGIIDAAFTAVHHGVQHSLYASGRAPQDRRCSVIDPFVVEVVEPFHQLRIGVDAAELGIVADLWFTACSPPVAHTRRRALTGARVTTDEGGLTQWGHWSGRLQLQHLRTQLVMDLDSWPADRTRTWGLVAAPPHAGAPARDLPQTFRIRSTLRFDDGFVLVDIEEGATGERRFGQGVFVSGPGDNVPLGPVAVTIEWVPGTRRPRTAELQLGNGSVGDESATGSPLPIGRISLEADGPPFPLRGLGFAHPHWSHGRWHDEHAVGVEASPLDQLDWTDVHQLHVRQPVIANWDGREGIGALEVLAVGDHLPTGLRGFTDGAP